MYMKVFFVAKPTKPRPLVHSSHRAVGHRHTSCFKTLHAKRTEYKT